MLIVVARYNENIEWTKEFPNTLIYNKGNDILPYDNIITLDNVGREGHTYYKYICDNYNNLEDYTIFLQGNPFDHTQNIITKLNYYINNKDLNINFDFLSDFVIHTSLNKESTVAKQCINIYKDYEKIFGTVPQNDECIFGCGAQFIVSKSAILNNPKEFYENIVKILEYSNDPDEGHSIERLHKYIFKQ